MSSMPPPPPDGKRPLRTPIPPPPARRRSRHEVLERPSVRPFLLDIQEDEFRSGHRLPRVPPVEALPNFADAPNARPDGGRRGRRVLTLTLTLALGAGVGLVARSGRPGPGTKTLDAPSTVAAPSLAAVATSEPAAQAPTPARAVERIAPLGPAHAPSGASSAPRTSDVAAPDKPKPRPARTPASPSNEPRVVPAEPGTTLAIEDPGF